MFHLNNFLIFICKLFNMNISELLRKELTKLEEWILGVLKSDRGTGPAYIDKGHGPIKEREGG